MNTKMSAFASFILLFSFFTNISFAQNARGGVGGGGGDPSEERVNEIRADILTWINQGGSEGLTLPADITLSDYNSGMISVLTPLAVLITFVSEDDPQNEELQVIVNGKPKTCRGFFAAKDSKPNILCNIKRFKETSATEQYKLIHHEYAGLAYLERNEGAASDYFISAQLSEYLKLTQVLKLAIKVKEKKNYAIDDQNQIIKLYYTPDLKDEIEYTVAYKDLKKIFPFLPATLRSDMILDTNYILTTLGHIKPFVIGYNQGNILAHFEEKEGQLYVVTYKLQYFQHRSEFYLSDEDFSKRYIEYYGDHELAKPAITRVLLGKAQDFSNPKNLWFATNWQTDGLTYLSFTANKQNYDVKINNYTSYTEEYWRINFIKKNDHFIKFSKDDVLYKWRLIYEDFAGDDNGYTYLKCNDLKCFKAILKEKNKNLSDLKMSIKSFENLKRINFNKDYVPLLLSVSKEESKFYHELAQMNLVNATFDLTNDKFSFADESGKVFLNN